MHLTLHLRVVFALSSLLPFLFVHYIHAQCNSTSYLARHRDNTLVATAYSVCVLTQQAKVRCWGNRDYDGVLFSSTSGANANTMGDHLQDVGISDNVVEIARCQRSNLALTAGGVLYSWGQTTNYCLGYSASSVRDSPKSVISGVRRILCVSCSAAMFVEKTNGDVFGWGKNYRILGAGSSTSGVVNPLKVYTNLQAGQSIERIACAGHLVCCILLSDGNVKCWGFHHGYGHSSPIYSIPSTSYLNFGDVGKAVQIGNAGDDSMCALFETRKVKCWGKTHNGGLLLEPEAISSSSTCGPGYTTRNIMMDQTCELGNNNPVLDFGAGLDPALLMSSGHSYTSVLLSPNGWSESAGAYGVKFWGTARNGKPFLPSTTSSSFTKTYWESGFAPGDNLPWVGVSDVLFLTGEFQFACAARTDLSVVCWGSCASGVCGYESNSDLLYPPSTAVDFGTGLTVHPSSIDCQACSQCPDGWTELRACGGYWDTYCKDCRCPEGEWASACDFDNALVCEACSVCAENMYQSQPCSATTDVVCEDCITNCGVGEYIASPCTGTADAVCAPCSCHIEGYYSPDGCDGVNDGSCVMCPEGYWCPGNSTAIQCPATTSAPAGSTSSNACVCAPGYYLDGTGAGCVICLVDHWCPGGTTMLSCPEFSSSFEGSDSGSDCVCNLGYFDNA